jgi:autotransporter-associated beta strand protein
LESYQFNGDSRNQNNTNLFNVEFTGNLRLGQSGIDVGRAGLVSVFQGNFSEVNSGLSLSKVGIDTIVLTGTANHTGGTFVNGGTLRLSRAATNNTTLLTDGIAGNTDVTINGGILEIGASEQIADNAGVVLNTNGTFRFNGSGRIETVGSFRNNGGTFISGANTLVGTGNTIEWFGGVNTISSGGLVRDKHVVITGGQNVVEGGGVLDVTSGAGTAGLIFGGTGSPNITLNSSAATAGSILLSQNVTVSNSVNGASITSGGSLANPGFIDLQGGTRTFTVEDGSATQDLTMGVQLQNGGFIKAGSGRMTLTSASTITGNVTVDGGTLELSADGALATPGQIQINTGGTLLIGGGSGNTIGNSVPVVFNGGTLNSGGLSETLGPLTLSANSTLNMDSGASILNFANSSGQTWAGGTTLLIQNWSGVSQAEGGTGGGIDQLIFGTSSSALTAGQLSQIKFQFNWGQSDAIMLPNGEVIAAVPEPATVIAILALVGLVSYHERRRLVALFRRLRA